MNVIPLKLSNANDTVSCTYMDSASCVTKRQDNTLEETRIIINHPFAFGKFKYKIKKSDNTVEIIFHYF